MTENRTNEEVEIDLRELFLVLLHKWWAIVLSALLAGVLFFGYTFFLVDPLYKAKALMYVNNSSISIGSTSVSISGAELSAAQKLVDTYIVILESRQVLNEVIDEGELDESYEQLKDMISAAPVNSTEVFEVVVTSTSPSEAEHIANTIAKVLPDKITDIVAGSDVRIVDYAVVPAQRSSPSYSRNTLIGLLVGAVLSAGIIILQHMLDDSIRTEDYITQTYPDIPLLAVVPDMTPGRQHGGGYYGYQSYGGGSGKRSRSASKRDSSADAADSERKE